MTVLFVELCRLLKQPSFVLAPHSLPMPQLSNQTLRHAVHVKVSTPRNTPPSQHHRDTRIPIHVWFFAHSQDKVQTRARSWSHTPKPCQVDSEGRCVPFRHANSRRTCIPSESWTTRT